MNTYEQIKRRHSKRKTPTLSPEEWIELRELLDSDMGYNDLLKKMNRGRGRSFIQQCVEDLGVNPRERQSRIIQDKQRDRYHVIYLANKAEIDALIADYTAIEHIRKEYGISRNYMRKLISEAGYDLEEYKKQNRAKVNQENAKRNSGESMLQHWENKRRVSKRRFEMDMNETLSGDGMSLEWLRKEWRAVA